MSESQLVSGLHSVRTLLSQNPEEIQQVWLDKKRRDKRMQAIEQRCLSAGIRPQRVSHAELDQLLPHTNHQGVIARSTASKSWTEDGLQALLADIDTPLLLALDGVQDPHNLGAVLRTADAAGVHAVIAPKDNAAGLTATVQKISSGASLTVPYIQVTNLARSIKKLQQQGLWVVGTAGEADQTLYETDLQGPLLIVMGGEQNGLRRLVRENCDHLVRLPMLGKVESLNVSVASGVVLYEAVRQRQQGCKT
ncbi:MAG: 23S rRNA (guanosine(2251)-2'-O)-methyltransferase RlmB [gamma proteobacterium symbiont of Bathyaustriella thionipta]|nr:23S rRNA (guanosine(2251)-2'-O)-methyltransferase RlmB [gamma proteobacterium symbiont of Bathyaustriella thionipta]